ncbi:MAG: site-specific DNA-methyltransferase [Coriobacteriia bacterium]|nr:site-specific DNA-methyltransferase [Coriobacteriia bacterium]
MVKRAAEVRLGDCREVMASMDAESVDAIVTDPPYGLSFMGKGWDHGVPGVEFWMEALRVAKPGSHLLAFGGTRTYHRLACAIEDSGWEIRDCVMWVYGSGFPKSHDVSKAIDKAAGAEREVIGPNRNYRPNSGAIADPEWFQDRSSGLLTVPATEAARQWSGWGTALKPAWEPIIVARKSLIGTVAENVVKHGTGGINVDGCRVGYDRDADDTRRKADPSKGWCIGSPTSGSMDDSALQGRWPANLIHDGSDEVESLTGSAARFFYCAKASKADRDEGLEARPVVRVKMNNGNDADGDPVSDRFTKMARNTHPTVKPTELMRYLCRLVTPPGGLILDPFCGSGSTGKAAVVEGFRFIGIEREAEYVEIARARISAFAKDASLFTW